ncbi:hypothetical protein ACEQPO_21200 [Bacillus sp. SL00103]
MENESGTLIEEESSMEQNLVVRGIAFEDQITRVTVCGLSSGLTTLSTIFTTLAKQNINVGYHHSVRHKHQSDVDLFLCENGMICLKQLKC